MNSFERRLINTYRVSTTYNYCRDQYHGKWQIMYTFDWCVVIINNGSLRCARGRSARGSQITIDLYKLKMISVKKEIKTINSNKVSVCEQWTHRSLWKSSRKQIDREPCYLCCGPPRFRSGTYFFLLYLATGKLLAWRHDTNASPVYPCGHRQTAKWRRAFNSFSKLIFNHFDLSFYKINIFQIYLRKWHSFRTVQCMDQRRRNWYMNDCPSTQNHFGIRRERSVSTDCRCSQASRCKLGVPCRCYHVLGRIEHSCRMDLVDTSQLSQSTQSKGKNDLMK